MPATTNFTYTSGLADPMPSAAPGQRFAAVPTPTPKTTILAARSPAGFRFFVRSLGRDGTFLTTANPAKARTFTADDAQAMATRLASACAGWTFTTAPAQA